MPAGSDRQVILWVDIKAPTPATRLLSLEVFSTENHSLRAVDTLVTPEESPVGVSMAKVEKFFLGLQGFPGYKFVNRDLYSVSADWKKVEGCIAKTPLLDLRFLLQLFFPTLTAKTIGEYERAFQMQPGSTPAAVLKELVNILAKRVREPSGSALRALKTVFRGLAKEYSDWLAQPPHALPDFHYQINPDFVNSLDRFENLTGGQQFKPADAAQLFTEPGKMTEFVEGFQVRKGQAKYAQAILRSIQQEATVLLEAATGTGKSLGYLVPTIASIAESDKRAVIVTRTKSLQEQLFRSDLRKIRRLIPDGFRISLLKGLSNYLCLLKYKLFQSELADYMGKIPPEFMAALIVWEYFTESGDITETAIFDQPNSETLLAKVTLEEGSCLGRQCAFYNECYAFRARKNAQRSSVVITNYALLFSDLVSSAEILGRFSHAVFDEAHRLESEAINAFSESIAVQSFTRGLERLSDDKMQPLLKQACEAAENPELLDGFEALTSRLFTHLSMAADDIRDLLKKTSRSQQDRIRFRKGEPVHELLCELWDRDADSLIQLREVLSQLLQGLNGKSDDVEVESLTQLRRQTNTLIRQINLLEHIPEVNDDSEVMWAVILDSGEVWLTVAPMNVGNMLYHRLYSRFDSMIFTSATLDSEDNFEWTASRLGLGEESERAAYKVKIRSPFPLDQQLTIALARYLPPPTAPEFADRLSKLMLRFRTAARLPTLVLCTSYRMVEDLARPLLLSQGQAGEVLFQSPDTLPQTLLSRFKASRNAILIGTESFWEGIDLPDDLLRLLFITRLPFAVPDDPLELARQEQAERRGQNPFVSVSIPHAVLKYRQGIGRMIRSASDWGAVIVADSRMGRKNYGQIFVSASPVEVKVYDNESLLVNETAKWLGSMRSLVR